MNGKIKTKFAALFAVALMITVCVVPVVDNAGVDAAPVSSTNGEVFEGYDITLYKEGGDYSGLVYYGATAPAGVVGATAVTADSNYWVDADGKFITVDMIPGYEVDAAAYGLPLIQVVYDYADAFNNIVGNIIIEQGLQKWTFPYSQSDNTKTQGVRQIQMGNGTYTDKLNLLPQNIAGDFKVTLSGTQGFETETVSETVNAGAATVVSGTIYDADGEVIPAEFNTDGTLKNGIKVTINEVLCPVDQNGRYELNVVPGTVVSVTKIAYYEDSTPKTYYTFDKATSGDSDPIYNFGTVNTSIQKDFTANESTRKVTLYTADSNVIANQTVTLAVGWYSQTDADGNKYTIASPADGKAVQISSQTNKNGELFVAYSVPEDESDDDVTYEYFMIVSAPTQIKKSSDVLYSFTTQSVSTGTVDKTISDEISGKKGTKDATTADVSLNANESITTVKVLSKNGNPVKGATVTTTWYKQTAHATDGKYVLDATNDQAQPLGVSDKNGVVKVSYIKPTAVTGATFYLVATETATDVGYNFEIASITPSSSGSAVDSIATQVNGKAATKAVSKIEAITLNAEENTYEVSGNVIYEDAEVSYTNGINGENEAVADKDGNYSFYLIEGYSSLITPSKTIGTDVVKFSPTSYTVASISEDVTVDFAKKADDVVTKPLKYQVKVEANTGVFNVDFDYKVNGVEFEQTISTIDQVATLTINAFPTDVIEVSASLNGYQVSAFDGYSAEAVYFNNLAYKIVKMVGGKEVAIPGATFDVTYVVDGVTKIKQMTADENGFAYWASTDANGTVYKDGYAQVAKTYPVDPSGTTIWRSILTPEGEELAYCTYDLGDFYKVTPAAVTIDYIAAYNVDDIYGVGGNDIAETYAYETVVGGTVALKAPSIDGFEFVAWMVDGVVVSESADYTLKVDAATCHVDALYSAVHYEEPAEGLSMNVLVIGIVILILGILAVAYGIISKKQ